MMRTRRRRRKRLAMTRTRRRSRERLAITRTRRRRRERLAITRTRRRRRKRLAITRRRRRKRLAITRRRRKRLAITRRRRRRRKRLAITRRRRRTRLAITRRRRKRLAITRRRRRKRLAITRRRRREARYAPILIGMRRFKERRREEQQRRSTWLPILIRNHSGIGSVALDIVPGSPSAFRRMIKERGAKKGQSFIWSQLYGKAGSARALQKGQTKRLSAVPLLSHPYHQTTLQGVDESCLRAARLSSVGALKCR